MVSTTIDVSGQNNTAYQGDAYKGDGLMGIGRFFQGIATAYLEEDTNTERNVRDDVVRNISHLTPEQLECLTNYFNTACEAYSKNEFGKDNAIADSKDAVKQIFDEYEDEMLPRILEMDCRHGLYDNTTTQLLADNAYAKTVIRSAQLTLDTIHKYQEHIARAALTVTQGLQVALGDKTEDVTDRDMAESIAVSMERTPKTSAFATDAAIYVIAAWAMEKVAQRYYFAGGKA